MPKSHQFVDSGEAGGDWGSWGMCPFCSRERPVDPRGRLYLHRRWAEWRSPGRGERGGIMVQCAGTGQPAAVPGD
jgi:hypothetical protein